MGILKGLTIGLFVVLAALFAPEEYKAPALAAGMVLLAAYAAYKIRSAKREANGEEETEKLLLGKL